MLCEPCGKSMEEHRSMACKDCYLAALNKIKELEAQLEMWKLINRSYYGIEEVR